MKKNTTLILVGSFLFVLFGLALYFTVFNSVFGNNIYKISYYEEGVSGREILPLTTGNFNLGEYQGTYETVYLGCIGSSQEYSFVIETNIENDGKHYICNSITSGNTLKLSSENKLIGSTSGGTNYIQGKITLPKGKIFINYDYSLLEYYSNEVEIIFKADNQVDRIKIPQASGKVHSLSGDGNYELVLDKETEIEFRIETITTSKNEDSLGNMQIYFEKYIEPVVLEDLTEKEVVVVIEEIIDTVKEDATPEEINEVIAQVEVSKNVKLTQEQKDLITKTIIDNQKTFNLNYLLYGIIGIFLIVLIFLVVKMRKK